MFLKIFYDLYLVWDLVSVLDNLKSNRCPKCGRTDYFITTVGDILIDPKQLILGEHKKLDPGKLLVQCNICGHKISDNNDNLIISFLSWLIGYLSRKFYIFLVKKIEYISQQKFLVRFYTYY